MTADQKERDLYKAKRQFLPKEAVIRKKMNKFGLPGVQPITKGPALNGLFKFWTEAQINIMISQLERLGKGPITPKYPDLSIIDRLFTNNITYRSSPPDMSMTFWINMVAANVSNGNQPPESFLTLFNSFQNQFALGVENYRLTTGTFESSMARLRKVVTLRDEYEATRDPTKTTFAVVWKAVSAASSFPGQDENGPRRPARDQLDLALDDSLISSIENIQEYYVKKDPDAIPSIANVNWKSSSGPLFANGVKRANAFPLENNLASEVFKLLSKEPFSEEKWSWASVSYLKPKYETIPVEKLETGTRNYWVTTTALMFPMNILLKLVFENVPDFTEDPTSHSMLKFNPYYGSLNEWFAAMLAQVRRLYVSPKDRDWETQV